MIRGRLQTRIARHIAFAVVVSLVLSALVLVVFCNSSVPRNREQAARTYTSLVSKPLVTLAAYLGPSGGGILDQQVAALRELNQDVSRLEIVDVRYQLVRLVIALCRVLKVGAYSMAKMDRLADIDHTILAVAIDVDPWPIGQAIELVLQLWMNIQSVPRSLWRPDGFSKACRCSILHETGRRGNCLSRTRPRSSPGKGVRGIMGASAVPSSNLFEAP